jgi:hypothetical protein
MAMNINQETSTVATRDRLLCHADEVMVLVPDRFRGSNSLGSLNDFTIAVDLCPGHSTDDDVRPPAKAIEAGRSDRS